MGLSDKADNISTLWKVVLISFAVATVYFFITTRSTLWDRDEPHLAKVAFEMAESGKYLVPTFNGEMWPAKPPLFFWLTSAAIRLFGPSEFACRFFNVIGMTATCILTFFIGRKIIGTKAGIWAMLIFSSSIMILVIGTAALTDGVMLPFVVAVMLLFTQMVIRGISIPYVILTGCMLGLGMLAKGPIGLMPLPAIAVILWFGRKSGTNAKHYLLPIGAGVVIGFLIFLAWGIPVSNATDGEFFRVFVGRDIINRALNPMEGHGGAFLTHLPYYLPVIIIGFFPWSLHLPGAFSAVAGARVGGEYGRTFLLSWILSAFILMTLAATKLPHYILFIWPGLALAVAGTITAARKGQLVERDQIWLRRGVWFFGPVAITLSLGLMVGPWFLQIPGLEWPALAAGIILSAMTVFAIHQHRANRPQVSAAVVLGGMVLFNIPVMLGVLPAIENIKIPPHIASAVNSYAPKETPVTTYEFHEPTLNFYLARHLERLKSPEALISWVEQPGPGILIIPSEKLDELQQQHGPFNLDEIASHQGLNYSKGDVLKVAALARKGTNNDE
ncbi:MAG: ArnT family glycosyltransferase [Planctomycetota bacterium]